MNIIRIKYIVLVLLIITFNYKNYVCKNLNFDKDIGRFKIGKAYNILGSWYYPKKHKRYDEIGMASWYGNADHGKTTANGAIFNHFNLTAAHKTLPLPCVVCVTNLENNKSVRVVVNDRGPFAKNRLIDLSKQAAIVLKMVEKGYAKVRVRLLLEDTKRLWSKLRC